MSRPARGLVGRDLARGPAPRPPARRLLPMALLGALLAGLALAALRVDLIRVRYGLAEVARERQQLVEERNGLTAALRSLRDPARLGRIARERGFERPERVISIAAPALASADPRP